MKSGSEKGVGNRSVSKSKDYDHLSIEKKWQGRWSRSKIYRSREDSSKDKYYVLDMFPYPSGEGLHVGHPKGYIATDVVSRFYRMRGYSVLHPMGFDAFGLPAENYAIKTKTNPAEAVSKNIKRFKKQLEVIGLDYDWSREICTTDPDYYRWTQWIFLQLLEKGLAYESYEPINWCPSCKTGLANEDVEDGLCERCGTSVEKKLMKQWVLKITDYADRLLGDLDAIDTSNLPRFIDKKNPPRPGKETVERRTVHAIVHDPKTDKFLCLKWKKYPWIGLVVGGVHDGEDIVEAARREVVEETGYYDLKYIRTLGNPVKGEYFAAHKDQNRVAITSGILFELASDEKVEVSERERETHEPVWMSIADMDPDTMTCAELPVWLERLSASSGGDRPKQANEDKYPDPPIKPLLDWPEPIKEAQRNWIGRSEGALIKFDIRCPQPTAVNSSVEVFTTRPDTLFGVTYVVLAPEHKLVDALLPRVENETEVRSYISKAKSETEIERTDAKKDKTGVELKGIKAINPANGKDVPVFIADYVLVDYGTGAVMAVPAHDERDGNFAKKYGLPITSVIKQRDGAANHVDGSPYTGDGIMIDSGKWNGRDSQSIKKEITGSVDGKWVTKYKLRDWVFSRQRYWGEPIPVIHCERCGIVPVPEKDLPLKLPKIKSYEPTGTGESPLAAIEKWVNTKCPKCKGKAKRETNTMPQWAGSSWYYLRYEDPNNEKLLVDPGKDEYWSPVDLYVGGAEHATRHLIYARFWHKFLYDIGVVGTTEPFAKLQSVGLIMGEDGRKMSKRFGNVINPDDIVERFGADTLRVYEMFMGPFDQQISWSTDSMVGARRFVEKVWRLSQNIDQSDHIDDALTKALHKTIKKVTEDIRELKFNTAISSLMIVVNEMERSSGVSREQFELLLKILAPFAPHITEELWMNLGNKGSIHVSPWPKYDDTIIRDEEVRIMVQIDGKVRSSFMAARDSSDQVIEKMARGVPEIAKWLSGKTVNKTIVVKNRLVNLVLNVI